MDTDATYQAPSVDEIKTLLTERFAGKVNVTKTETRRVYATLPKEIVHEVCEYIHEKLTFEHISTVIGVDMVDYMQVVYHISNYHTGTMIELTTNLDNHDLHVQSISDIWVGGNWHERETYELFGIIFDGHPKLERLLTPDTYEFYPFRKSYKLRGQE
ncbi:MAG: NADH-quinone oxidoreductase subunit C [Candidatus Methanomethylophilaceae archaeon]|nr:NADH-quinone oxidoreductase subunit C [Candidatus Methanomethylophilaceae archaeon]MDD3378381.1 NADH-quinone oxidoreductase subunit C [Candidatus Methanomethylophilaceae archaeon]MDY0224265.1 NADH-quinone oxidoreductase subunit C [Candidatus Methanomethylophilaceae archaeon]